MHKTFFIIAIFFFGSHCCVAQKILEKEFAAEGIHTLSIVDDAIFKITIQSSEESTIKVVLQVSGEHSESVIIEEKIADGILSLKTGFVPFFTLENDKLAAHKIMAVEVKLLIPKEISIEIKSNLASVFTSGAFKNLAVSIENAKCDLQNFSGNAHLKTVNGNITVFANNDVSGKAISKNGTVENRLSAQGKFLIEAETINGSISLLQTK